MGSHFVVVGFIALFDHINFLDLLGRLNCLILMHIGLIAETKVRKSNRCVVVFCSEVVPLLFELEIGNVIVTNPRCLVIGAIKHLASLCQLNDSQYIRHPQETIVGELLV
jgi:hypothetical protein